MALGEGAELAACSAALERRAAQPPPEAASPSPSPPGAWHAPPHLLRNNPSLREAVNAAEDASKRAAAHGDDFPALYQCGLALQELASRLGGAPGEQLAVLQAACDVYVSSARLRASAPVLYNHAVALSDVARILRPAAAEEAWECLTAAASKYAACLAAGPPNPQALNNWGLVLQELAGLRPPGDRPAFVAHSVAKFRRAIRLRPDFDRAIYNLGTVLYAAACALQEELLSAQEPGPPAAAAAPAAPGAGGPAGAAQQQQQAAARPPPPTERAVREEFAHAGQYIVAAYCQDPQRPVYRESLAAVLRLVPIPYLRAGPLLALRPAPGGAPSEAWARCWFGADAGGLRAVRPPASEAGDGEHTPPAIAFPLEDLADAAVCVDASLPRGHGIWVGLNSRPLGAYLVAPGGREDAEGWVDALLLLMQLRRARRLGALEVALAAAPRRGRP